MNPHYPEVSHRAAHRCEYYHAPEVIFNFPFEVEHVIPIYHEGADEPSNLALACRSCNIHKASHLTGFDEGPITPHWQEALRQRGIEFTSGVLREEALALFRDFGQSGQTVYNGRAKRTIGV